MMSKITKGITFIVLLITSICFSQNDCVEFKDYEESQQWVKSVNSLNPLEKKNEILNRINCEIKSNGKIKCNLLLLINGQFINPNSLTKKEILILESINAEKFVLAGANLNICRCNSGFLIISQPKELILNEIKTLFFSKIKRIKNKIILKIVSEDITEIKIKRELIFSSENRIYNYDVKLKKGRNRIVLKTTNRLDLIEIKNEDKKSLIVI